MTVSANTLSRERFKVMSLPKELKDFFGQVTDDVHFRVLLSGRTQTGKSSFLLKVADKLARKDVHVLYGNFEEKTNVGTITAKLNELRIRNENIHFLEDRSITSFYRELETGKYKFAVIDSLSVLYTSRNEIQRFFNELETKFPNTVFFIVVHYMKDGKDYQGSTLLQHDADIFWETSEGGKVITRKNRFMKGNTKPTMKIWK